jgi:hypothetical protein
MSQFAKNNNLSLGGAPGQSPPHSHHMFLNGSTPQANKGGAMGLGGPSVIPMPPPVSGQQQVSVKKFLPITQATQQM